MAEEKDCTMMARKRGAAIYVRVSTDKQTVENQVRELRQIAERRGWEVVEQYSDAGISGSKGRDGRPGLDLMLSDAKRRKFDVVMAWAIDRLGRSLVDLLHTIQELEAAGVDLYLDQQSIDTTTPMGKLMFQVTGAFAEFERGMIRQRIHAGLKRAIEAGRIVCGPVWASSRSPAKLASATAPCSASSRRWSALSWSPREASPLSGRAWDLPTAPVKAGARAIDLCHHQAPAAPSASRPRSHDVALEDHFNP
jgi:DNA invertase Pin-like site-specific DNA recombinase